MVEALDGMMFHCPGLIGLVKVMLVMVLKMLGGTAKPKSSGRLSDSIL